MTPTGLAVALALLASALPLSIAAVNFGLGLTTLMLLLRRASWRPALHPAVYATACYVAAGAISSLFGLEPRESLSLLYKDAHKLWVLSALLAAFAAEPAPWAEVPLAAGFSAAALVGLAQALFGGGETRAHAFAHPVTYGEMMALAALGGFYWLRDPESPARRRPWALGFIALSGAALLANQTRGALLGLLAGLAPAFWLDPRLKRWRLPAAAAAALSLTLWETFAARARSFSYLLHQPLMVGGQVNPYLARLPLWSTAWRMFRDHPWTGVGPGLYRETFHRYFSGTMDAEKVWGSAHNLYLHQAAERGLLGLAALTALLGVLTARAWRRARAQPNARRLWACGAMTAFLVMNLTEVAFQNEQAATCLLFLWAWGEAS